MIVIAITTIARKTVQLNTKPLYLRESEEQRVANFSALMVKGETGSVKGETKSAK